MYQALFPPPDPPHKSLGTRLSSFMQKPTEKPLKVGQVAGWSSTLILLGSGAPMSDIRRDLLGVFSADRPNLGRVGVLPMFSSTAPPGFGPFPFMLSVIADRPTDSTTACTGSKIRNF